MNGSNSGDSSKQLLINNISNKLHNFFITKYGDQFKSLQLDSSKINKIVSVKLDKEQITKSKIPILINTLQEIINKIVVKKIYDVNNSNVIIKPKEKEENSTPLQIPNDEQHMTQKNTREIDNRIFTNLINQQELKKEMGVTPKKDIKPELDLSYNDDLEKMKSEYREKFPMRERVEDVNEIKTLIEKKILNFYLVVNSLERDVNLYSSPYQYNKSLDYLGKFKNITIKKITLINCIIKKTSQISRSPFITLNIKELDSEYYGTNQDMDSIFCYLDLYKKQNDYLYYECNTSKSIEFTPGIIIDGLTVSLHLPNGDLLKETENTDESKSKPESKPEPKQLKIKDADDLDDLNDIDILGDLKDADVKPLVKTQSVIKKRKKKDKQKDKHKDKHNKYAYECFNNQFIFNIEYEFTI